MQAANLSFGPVVEKWLAMRDDIINWTDLLDLDTGTVVHLLDFPDRIHSGFAINYSAQYNIAGLAGMNGVVVEVSNPSQWDAITDLETVERLHISSNSPGLRVVSPTQHANQHLPLTYLFKSAAGKIGILQITGFTENPRGVKIRYKLVQNPNEKTVSAQPGLPASAFQIRLVADDLETDIPTDTLTNNFDGTHIERLRLVKDILMDGKAVERAGWHTADGRTNFVIGLTETGSQQFEALTAASLKRRIAVIFQGRVLCSPIIQSRISTRSLDFSVNWDRKDMERTMNGLNQMNNPVVNLHFGPEQEKVLPTIEWNWTFLNLRANRLMTNSHPDPESRAFHDWQRENGADLVATVSDVVATEETLPGLIGYRMATAPAVANGLDNNSATDIWYNWNLMVNEPEGRSYLAKAPNSGQDTYYFRTGDDTWGVLQIIGFTDDLHGVKLRYKLVQNGGAEN
jgi:hypothetical protein